MTPFDFSQRTKELLASGAESIAPTAAARAASEQLCDAVTSIGWEFLEAGERLRTGGSQVLVVGVVTWDPPELDLLRNLAGRTSGTRIVVFDLDQVGGQDEVPKVMPGVGKILQSPAVGWYRLGNLHQFAEGKAAYEVVQEFMDSAN